MKRWFGYALLAAIAVTFLTVWILYGDFFGALGFTIVVLLALALPAAVLAYIVSNAPIWIRTLRGTSWEDHLASLEDECSALREHYDVLGAVSLEDLNTSCLIHFLDIGDGRILCPYGQQYYDFEPISDDPEVNRPRRFPTRDFSLLRHSKKNDVLDIFPGSDVFEPTIRAEIVDLNRLFDLGFTLKDGEIVKGANLKAIEQAAAGSAS